MASQTPNNPVGKTPKKADAPKRGSKNPFVYGGTIVILIITVIAFVLVPSVGGVVSKNTLSFGSYAGKVISYSPRNYLAQQVQSINDALRQRGLSEENFQLFAYQVWRSAFERTVVHEGILDAVESAGATVSEARLDERMAELPQFQEDGVFSNRLYRESNSSTRLELRKQLKDDLLSQYFFSDVYRIGPSTKESEFVRSMAKETRSIEYAVFPLSSYPDSEISAWASQNSSLFRKLHLSRITLATEDEATKVKKDIEGGLAFPEAAKSHSTDSRASQGGDLGLRFFHELSAELESAEDAEKIATLAVGTLSPVVKTLTGSFAFYRLEEAVKPAELSDPSLLASAKTYMNSHERGKIEDWVSAKAGNFAKGAAADFSGAAKDAGISLKSVGPFPLNYGDIAVSLYGQTMALFPALPVGEDPELEGASRNEKFLTAAFSLAPGAVSDPIVLGDNIIVLRVTEVGAALDDTTAIIPIYYPFLFQEKVDAEVRDMFLKSPKLKDEFMNAYLKYFSPKKS